MIWINTKRSVTAGGRLAWVFVLKWLFSSWWGEFIVPLFFFGVTSQLLAKTNELPLAESSGHEAWIIVFLPHGLRERHSFWILHCCSLYFHSKTQKVLVFRFLVLNMSNFMWKISNFEQLSLRGMRMLMLMDSFLRSLYWKYKFSLICGLNCRK